MKGATYKSGSYVLGAFALSMPSVGGLEDFMKKRFYGCEWECDINFGKNEFRYMWIHNEDGETFYLYRVGYINLFAVYDGEFLSTIGVTPSDPWDESADTYRLNEWEKWISGLDTGYREGLNAFEKAYDKVWDTLNDMMRNITFDAPNIDDEIESFMYRIQCMVEGSTSADDFVKFISETIQ